MDKWLYRASVALVVLGLLVSTYMYIYKITDNSSMCLGNDGCSDVIHSKYSEVNDFISVPQFGIGGFIVLLALLLLETRYDFFKTNGTLLVFATALIGFLFTLWLIYVELVLIKKLCPFCVTAQTTMILVFTLSIIRLMRQPQTY
jgi:uncharacterized membrane protein